MFKASFITAALIALSTQGQAIDLGKMLSAGADAVKSISMSDKEIKSIASGAKTEYDKLNKVASPGSKHGKRLAKLIKGMKLENGPELDIKVYLVKDVNAFAMADGTVRVFAGLMDAMNDDEVRYVIGHEIGHVSLGHSKKALQTAYASSALRKGAAASGNQLAGAISESALGALAEKLVHSQFSQSQELDADMYALKLMKSNQYNPKAAVSALQKLQAMFGNSKSLFSSHPAPGDRAKALEKAL